MVRGEAFRRQVEHQVLNAQRFADLCACFTLQAIADRYGCHINSVWLFARRNAHRSALREHASDIAEDLAYRSRLTKIRSRRYTTSAIARSFGVHRAYVENIKYQLKS